MIYYISNTGVGYSNEQSTPGNIYETINIISPEDEIICLPGEYDLNKTINIKNESDSIITVKGIDFVSRPIFNFVHQKFGNNGIELAGKNIILQDIIVQNSGYKGVVVYGNNCFLNRIESAFSGDSGIQLYGESNEVRDCDAHHSFGYRNVHIIGNYGFSSDGFSDKLHKGEGNTFINCRAWSNTDDGFDFFGRDNHSTENPSKLINCWSFYNGRSKWNMEKHPRYQTDKDFLDQFKEGKTVISRWGEKIYVQLNEFPAFGNGNGFKLSGDNAFNNIQILNCIAAGNKFKGFDQNSNIGKIFIKDCIAYRNPYLNFGFFLPLESLIIESSIHSKGNCHFLTDSNIDCKKEDLDFDIYQLMQPRNSDGSLPKIIIK